MTESKAAETTRPSVVTSGYSTVDVLSTSTYRAAPGGTAVNVARALASLGWESELIGTIGTDPGGTFIRNQLKSSGVEVARLYQDIRWTTPVIVQEMHGSDHSWRFKCPECGTAFAKHRPTSPTRIGEIVAARPAPDVFFFDRTSLFTIGLAEAWSAAGSFVVFEPAGLGRPHLFDRAVKVADLVKFSRERAASFSDRVPKTGVLVVETLGVDGTRFRLPHGSVWHQLHANVVTSPVDYVGAGDWTTTGLLDSLLRTEPLSVGLESVRGAVQEGQRLGSLAISWEGAHPAALKALPGGKFEPFACPRYLAERR